MADEKCVSAMDISASALSAERRRMAIIAGNIANANSMITKDGEPYRKREVTFATVMNKALQATNPAGAVGGVKIASVSVSKQPYKRVYRPGHYLADKKGYVKMPNVNVTEEMVNMVEAQRAYDANLSAMKAYRDMLRSSLNILK